MSKDNVYKFRTIKWGHPERKLKMIPDSIPHNAQISARQASLCRAHLVECCLSKLKQFRRVATRFEKTARNYRAVVTLAAIILWMR